MLLVLKFNCRTRNTLCLWKALKMASRWNKVLHYWKKRNRESCIFSVYAFHCFALQIPWANHCNYFHSHVASRASKFGSLFPIAQPFWPFSRLSHDNVSLHRSSANDSSPTTSNSQDNIRIDFTVCATAGLSAMHGGQFQPIFPSCGRPKLPVGLYDQPALHSFCIPEFDLHSGDCGDAFRT